MEKLRHCIFKGRDNTTFSLTLWDTGRTIEGGKAVLKYRLNMSYDVVRADGKTVRRDKTIFEGEDFYPSPWHSIDGDSTVKSLMTFLTLRPGDTDAEYFTNYTDTQRDFAESHAEYLACEIYARYGE